jgi:hypothetical protein
MRVIEQVFGKQIAMIGQTADFKRLKKQVLRLTACR